MTRHTPLTPDELRRRARRDLHCHTKYCRHAVGEMEDYVRSAIDVPAAEIRRSGRTRDWRLRIVWRGRVLASRSSPGWERRVRP